MTDTARLQRRSGGLHQVPAAVRGMLPERLRRFLATIGPAALIMLISTAFWPAKLGVLVRGATIGLLTALVAIGMALIYRANRVVNFSQADLGYAPGFVVVTWVAVSGLNYFLGFFGVRTSSEPKAISSSSFATLPWRPVAALNAVSSAPICTLQEESKASLGI